MKLLGIDLGGTKTAVCVGDAAGQIHARRRRQTALGAGWQQGLADTARLCRELLTEQQVPLAQIAAVGISAPGPVSVRAGMMLEPPNMKGWENVPLVDFFSREFGRPVVMNNDANACALAEYRFGEFKGTPDLVYLTMSTGLGGGIIAGGRLIQGATDLAGEVGHHVLDINGPPCPCGQRGCWELYCGGMNVANRLRERMVRENIRTAILEQAGGDPARIDFKCFVDAVRLQDAFARAAWDEYLERLAQGVGSVLQFYNPSVIVMGTIAIHAGDLIFPELERRLPRYAWKQTRAACRIAASALGTHVGDLSALALAASHL